MTTIYRKQYIIISIILLSLCFILMFSNLLYISFIHQQRQKENQNYIDIFTNLYTKTFLKDLTQLLINTDALKIDLLKDLFKTEDTIKRPENINFNILDIKKFLISSPSAKKLEIIYSSLNSKNIGMITSEKDLSSDIKISYIKIQDISKKFLFLKKQINNFNATKMKIHPIVKEKSLKSSLSFAQEEEEIFLPISCFSQDQKENWLIIKVYFSLRYIKENMKDFLYVSNFLIENIILIWQDGQPLPIINITDNGIPYDIPIFKLTNSPKITFLGDIFNSNKEINTSQSKFEIKNTFQVRSFEIEKVNQTFGLLFKMHLRNLDGDNSSFFALFSILIINIGFLFLAIHYGISYYFVQNIHRILEQGSLKFTIQFDPQTGVFTRSSIQEVAIRFINMEQNFVLSILDIDFFKKINDKFGHLVGDLVLLDLCEKIETQFHQWEKNFPEGKFSLGRWGGEEFLLIMCLENSNQLITLLNTLQSKISQPSLTKDLPNYTVSLGACCISYEEIHTNSLEIFRKLFKKADLALYEAKRKGKNQVIFKNFKG